MSKVLFHLNDQNKVEATLKNIENLIEDSDKDIEIELVVHSEAVYSFMQNKINDLNKINMLDWQPLFRQIHSEQKYIF